MGLGDPFVNATEIVRLNHTDGQSCLLMNKHNKCMSACSITVGPVRQSNCDPNQKGQLWKWDSGRLCNDCNRCNFISETGSTIKFKNGKIESTPTGFEVFQWPFYDSNKSGHKWIANGFGQLVSSRGPCLGVKGDSNAKEAILSVDSCDKKENGQFWGFYGE